jgi:hypothetical protein
MSMFGSSGAPGRGSPAAARGMPPLAGRPVVATYATYAEAQRAVDYLSDQHFAVQNLGILGRDLRMEESVLGRLSWNRVAINGLVQGAWLGLFVGLVISLFAEEAGSVILYCVLWGLAFGLGFQLLGYALQRGQRDFVSRSSVTAQSYEVVCTWEHVEEAKRVLAGLPPATG